MLPLARHAAREALRLAPNLAEAQTSESLLNFWLERNLPAAEAAARRAIALNSNYQLAQLMLANILSHSGRHREAQEHMRRAREVDPLDPMMIAISSQNAFHARDYPGAVDYARQALLVDPEFWIAYMPLGLALERMGKTDLALDAFDKAARFSGGNSKALSARGHVLGTTGRTAEARHVLKALTDLSHTRYVPPSAIALVHAGLGQREAAFESLTAACAARDVHLVFLPVDPRWDRYLSDPAFNTRLARCGFTQQSRSNTPAP
jgi:tetratricopeptide (TPR) repeat protein